MPPAITDRGPALKIRTITLLNQVQRREKNTSTAMEELEGMFLIANGYREEVRGWIDRVRRSHRKSFQQKTVRRAMDAIWVHLRLPEEVD